MNSKFKGTKKIFWKLGTCSRTFFFLLNREFGNNNENAEIAADPLAGGVMLKGHQCGMLWGATLGVGAESWRRKNDVGDPVALAISSSQKVQESFVERTGTPDCRSITKTDFSNKFQMFTFTLFRAYGCFKLAEKWAPEAVDSAEKALAEKPDNKIPAKSCAAEVVKKMGGSDEEAVTVAGMAGGIGLSGNACGALSAAIWMKTLEWSRKNPGKSAFPVPNSINTMRAFYSVAGDEMLCSKLCGKKFNSIDEHTEFIKNGGCGELIEALARA